MLTPEQKAHAREIRRRSALAQGFTPHLSNPAEIAYAVNTFLLDHKKEGSNGDA